MNDERWNHILLEHAELAGLRESVLETIASPERVLQGTSGEMLAVSEFEAAKFLVVVYRDSEDGFVITAFLTRRAASLDRRRIVWPL
jgi:hypothetical protein